MLTGRVFSYRQKNPVIKIETKITLFPAFLPCCMEKRRRAAILPRVSRPNTGMVGSMCTYFGKVQSPVFL